MALEPWHGPDSALPCSAQLVFTTRFDRAAPCEMITPGLRGHQRFSDIRFLRQETTAAVAPPPPPPSSISCDAWAPTISAPAILLVAPAVGHQQLPSLQKSSMTPLSSFERGRRITELHHACHPSPLCPSTPRPLSRPVPPRLISQFLLFPKALAPHTLIHTVIDPQSKFCPSRWLLSAGRYLLLPSDLGRPFPVPQQSSPFHPIWTVCRAM